MIDVDEKNFRRWLNLTEQQYDIVKIIFRLRNRGIQPTPKNIQREYKNELKKYLMKPNLFNILRILIQKNIITKAATADYMLDLKGIKEAMNQQQQSLESEMEEFKQTKDHVEQYFREQTYKKEQADIQYLEEDKMGKVMAELVDQSQEFFIVTDFPQICYSPEVLFELQREEYIQSIWNKIKAKNIQINILTTLSIDTLFNHCFRAYSDPKIAYQQSVASMERLKTITKAHRCIDIRYTPEPPGLDVAISKTQHPTQFMIFLRDEHDDIHAGMRVKSHKTAANALKTFERTYNYSNELKKEPGKKIIQTALTDLEKRYAILVD